MSDLVKPRLEVCLSPALLNLYDTAGVVVVIIDVFRATSTITAALYNGAKCVVPVASVEGCIALGATIPGSLTAGERDGKVAEGLQYGNSPLEYPGEFIDGKTLILTTTNGTRLLHMVRRADCIIIGSFLNLAAVCDFLVASGKNVLLACSSWKDRVNMEDTLFAGAVVSSIGDQFSVNCDSARIARQLFQVSENVGRFDFLRDTSHFNRLAAFGLMEDMEYCLVSDSHPVVPILKGDVIVTAIQA